jgi:putative copper resistance protein D
MIGLLGASSGSGNPVLPVSWCRYGQDLYDLSPLSGWRFFTAWQLDAVALVALIVAGAGYGRAVHRVAVAHPVRPWPRRRSASFGAGLLVIFLATHSSVAVYDMSLFSVHMAQHLMLIMVAPPLLAAGRPLTLLLHAVHNPWHSRIKRTIRSLPVAVVTSPPFALTAYATTIVATHLSGLMDQIMQHPWLGQAEHLLYVVAGYLFFVLVFGDEPIRWRLSMPGRLLLVVMSMAVDTFVGIVLLQTTQPIAYIAHPGWGPNPLRDTQTGGAIMWFFGDAIMVVLIVLTFRAWVRRPEYARRQSHSWLERARVTTFDSHVREAPVARTGRPPDAGPATAPPPGERPDHPTGRPPDLDDDDARWAAYNAWLGRLAERDAQAGDHHGRR